MKFHNNTVLLLCLAVPLMALSSCRRGTGQPPMPYTPDLAVYSCQDKSVAEPIIKEFEERTGLLVNTEYGSSNQLKDRLAAGGGLPWDLVFGAGTETLEQMKERWLPYESLESGQISPSFRGADGSWTPFSALPLVILYNTNVVTYREVPVGWESLLEPRWRGRVAFGDPTASDLYASALVTAVQTCPDNPAYLEDLIGNINAAPLPSIAEVNSGIAEGQFSVGVTLEGNAQTLIAYGADVDYVYPIEGTTALTDGIAIIKDCLHPEAAKQFTDFTVSKDVQLLLVSQLNRRPVRTDISPGKGLSSISHLPLADFDLSELNQEKENLLLRWNSILSGWEGRDLP